MKMKKIRLSFQIRLYLYILFLTVVIFGCIAIAFGSYSRQQEETQASLYSFALQNATIQNMDDELEWMESAVEMTIGKHMSNPTENHSNALKFIGQLVKNSNLILGVGYISYDKEVHDEATLDYVYEDEMENIVYKEIPLKQYDYTKAQWYKNAVHKDKGEWTEPYVDQTGSHKAIVSYAKAMRDEEDHVKGVVVVDVSLTDLSDELSTVQPFQNSYSFILSKKGTIIAHPDTSLIYKENIFTMARILKDEDYTALGEKMLAGEKGTLHCELDDTDMLICYATLPHVGWTVASVCPYSTIKSEMGSFTFTALVVSIIGIILMLICFSILIFHMVRPLREMTDAAYRIAQGDFNVTLPKMSTDGDFGKLHAAFTHMQHSIKTYISDLEKATKERERINSELHVAHHIQMEILPVDFVLPQGYENIDIDAFLSPARSVGGDFYDFWLEDRKIYFAIGDVSGKGVAAAMVMAMTCTLFRSLVSKYESTSEIMSLLNKMLTRNNQTEMFVTMLIGVLDTQTGNLTYCNAGHNAPFLFSPTGCSQLPLVPKLPLGLFDGVAYTEQKCTMEESQTLLLYTDGLTEAENEQRKQMGTQRVKEILEGLGERTSHEVIMEMRRQLKLFVGNAEQSDDLTLFAISYKNCESLIIDNRLAEMEKLPVFLDKLGNQLGLEKPLLLSIRLALEEAMVNVVNYAYPKGETGKINLKVKYEPQEAILRFELTDSGKPFDPTAVKDADLTQDVEDRPIGGLGIFLIKKRMDELTYKRENGMNKLMMIKKIRKVTK